MAAKRSRTLAETGWELMDRKRSILIRELMGRVDEARELQSRIGGAFAEAYDALRAAELSSGDCAELAAAVDVDESVRLRFRSVMGVEIPAVTAEKKSLAGAFSGIAEKGSSADIPQNSKIALFPSITAESPAMLLGSVTENTTEPPFFTISAAKKSSPQAMLARQEKFPEYAAAMSSALKAADLEHPARSSAKITSIIPFRITKKPPLHIWNIICAKEVKICGQSSLSARRRQR